MSTAKKINKKSSYQRFDQLDGSHPFKSVLPDGFVDYPARLRKGGDISYFNFDLAIEMGLVPSDHDKKLDQELKDKILETFAIQIINEYDQEHNIKVPKDEMKSGTYMATRYLQLQHENKQGKTSGDGRTVWNGQVKHKGQVWDVSSGGTGATKLSPATSKYGRYFKTGDPTISYGCGYAEVDEGFATAVLSKIYDINNYSTEQTLAIIEYKNNISINVRVHKNLLRPSHFFLYLKQDDLNSIKKITDFYIERQRDSGVWAECPKNYRKYDYFLDRIVETFARLAARFEDDYIFCWLDWDGDNILMDGGIIDYGSIRQFGLFHYEYRYDDVERYSTNLLEQKGKAKYIVQSFIQLIDYLKTGTKNNIQDFSNHKLLSDFESVFDEQKNFNFLYKLGLSERKSKQVLKRYKKDIIELRKVYSYFKKTKSSSGMVEISDGVTWDAVLNTRDLLREFPQLLMVDSERIAPDDFMEMMRSSLATEEDLAVNSYRKQKIDEFQDRYLDLVDKVSKLFQESREDTLLQLAKRSQIINKPYRVTGDATTYIVSLILEHKKKLKVEQVDALLDALAISQNLDPDQKLDYPKDFPRDIFLKIMHIVKEHREGI